MRRQVDRISNGASFGSPFTSVVPNLVRKSVMTAASHWEIILLPSLIRRLRVSHPRNLATSMLPRPVPLFHGSPGSTSWTRAIISSIDKPYFHSGDSRSLPVATPSTFSASSPETWATCGFGAPPPHEGSCVRCFPLHLAQRRFPSRQYRPSVPKT